VGAGEVGILHPKIGRQGYREYAVDHIGSVQKRLPGATKPGCFRKAGLYRFSKSTASG
jgi:hypothetical protein